MLIAWSASEGAQGGDEDGETRRERIRKRRHSNTSGGRWKMMRSRLRNMRSEEMFELSKAGRLEMKAKQRGNKAMWAIDTLNQAISSQQAALSRRGVSHHSNWT